jgi:hypothetical protein
VERRACPERALRGCGRRLAPMSGPWSLGPGSEQSAIGSWAIHDADAARELWCTPVEHGQEVVLECLGVARDALEVAAVLSITVNWAHRAATP